MKNYNNITKKIVVYTFIVLLLFSCLNYVFSTLDNDKTVTITMRQSSENDVKIAYKEDKYDSRNLEVGQTLPSSDVYDTIKIKIPIDYVYALDLKLNTKEGKTNKVDIQKLTVSTLFTKHEIKDFNNTHYKISEETGKVKTIASEPLFSDFELYLKPKIIAMIISIFVIFLLHNQINNILNKPNQTSDNSKVLIFTSFLILVFFANLVTLETEFSFLKLRQPIEKPILKDYDYVLDFSYMQQVEDYARDHFLFSDFFTEDYFAFNELLQKNELNNTYLTNVNDKKVLLTPYDIHSKKGPIKNLDNIHRLSQFLEEKNIPHLYFLAPSKDYTLSQTFGKLTPNYVTNDSTKIHKIFAEGIPEDNDYVQFYDLINYMDKDDIKNGTTHFDTDHHWTIETAFGAYEQILKALSENGLEPATETEFKSKTFEDKFAGSEARKTAYGYRYNQTRDDFTLIYPADLGSYTVTSLTDGNTRTGNFLELLNTSAIYESSDYTNAYTVYNIIFGCSKTTNNTIDNDTTIVLIGDSYAKTVAWFLSTSYKNVVFIDPRKYDNGFTENYINENSDNIDAVINLNYLHPPLGRIFNYFK